MCAFFKYGPQYSRNRYMDAGAQWSAIIVNEDYIVAVEFGHFDVLGLLKPDKDSLFLLPLDSHHHSVTNVANTCKRMKLVSFSV